MRIKLTLKHTLGEDEQRLLRDVNESVAAIAGAIGKFTDAYRERTEVLAQLLNAFSNQAVIGGDFMQIVPATHPDSRYAITEVDTSSLRDSESNLIHNPSVTYEVSSDNPSAVELIPDDPANPRVGAIRWGTIPDDEEFAIANVTALTKVNGQLVKTSGAQFTIVAGALAAAGVAGGDFQVNGLEDLAPPPPAETAPADTTAPTETAPEAPTSTDAPA
jgi:hypothetical protein